MEDQTTTPLRRPTGIDLNEIYTTTTYLSEIGTAELQMASDCFLAQKK